MLPRSEYLPKVRKKPEKFPGSCFPQRAEKAYSYPHFLAYRIIRKPGRITKYPGLKQYVQRFLKQPKIKKERDSGKKSRFPK